MKPVIVALASKNPVKERVVRSAFVKVLGNENIDLRTVDPRINLPPQPKSDEETLLCARKRVQALQIAEPRADYYAGIEGGVTPFDGRLLAFAWVVVAASGREESARCASFPLPENVCSLINSGLELGQAMDRLSGEVNSKEKMGASGLLTGGLVDRHALYEQAAILALSALQRGLCSLLENAD